MLGNTRAGSPQCTLGCDMPGLPPFQESWEEVGVVCLMENDAIFAAVQRG